MSYNHVRLYCDTEFNSGGGEIISAAMVSSQGHRWYQACHPEGELDYWPRKYVIPVLGIPQISKEEMAESFKKFTSQFDVITLVVDGKVDARHFADLIDKHGYPSQLFNFEYVRVPDGLKKVSKVLHNALSDAQAYMSVVLGSKAVDARGVAPWDVYSVLDQRGVGLNTTNSRFEVIAQAENGDMIVEVFPVCAGGNAKRKYSFLGNYNEEVVGVYRLQVPVR